MSALFLRRKTPFIALQMNQRRFPSISKRKEEDAQAVIVFPAKKHPAHYFMSASFSLMGVGCVLVPEPLMKLSFAEPMPTDPTSILIFQCFGLQATLLGIVLANSHLTIQGYRNWILSILPFFYFDFYFYTIAQKLSLFGSLGDALGNIIFTACGLKCISYMKEQQTK